MGASKGPKMKYTVCFVIEGHFKFFMCGESYQSVSNSFICTLSHTPLSAKFGLN